MRVVEYENLSRLNAPLFDSYTAAFESVMKKGWYILGQAVQSFEEEFAGYCGARSCIGVASGLDALFLALKACDIKAGDEVIVPSNTYIATILAVLHTGATPVLVEPDRNTCNIDPAGIESAITSRTKAILIVHLYGLPCEMDAIQSIVSRHNLFLLEDCAQSHGARFQTRMTGTFGHVGCFSFYPTKNLGALGDGGAIITGDDSIAEKVRKLRNYGSSVKYINEVAGFNSRLDELQAAFLSLKLRFLDAIVAHKRKLAGLYRQSLDSDFLLPPQEQEGIIHSYHIFNVRHPARDALRDHLLEAGIKTEIHYPVPPHKQKAMAGILTGNYPISEEIHATTLSLPISWFHTPDDVEYVIETMNRFASLQNSLRSTEGGKGL